MKKVAKQTGSLTIVGSGIKAIGHITLEARAFIEQAEKLFFGVNDPTLAKWLLQANPTAEPLTHLYKEGKLRQETYQEMAELILSAVRQNKQVCAVFYGHPGVFVTASHLAIKQAKTEGYHAQLLPGISAEDCLFADLGIDPAITGCQTFEATEFLLRTRQADPTTALILWQIGIIGEFTKQTKNNSNVKMGLQLITQQLMKIYGPIHEVINYEAAQYATYPPTIERFPLNQLPDAELTPISTLYIPPKTIPPWNEDVKTLLGIS